ncbi:unannotated protein [freshwater metagenome]|uniref:Unannotated protein n=1 Tax=freshwater metagenome TaxID=449393 RepID=A0A6J6N099_9ZZZZ
MKTNDVLADEVVVDRPISSELFFVGSVSVRGDVISQCVEPNICNMRIIPWQLDSPCQSFSTHREISETLLYETSYFIDAMIWFDCIRVICVPLQKFFFVARQAKEIVFFFDILGLSVMDFAFAVVELFRCVVSLAGNTIMTAIDINFNVASVITGLQ